MASASPRVLNRPLIMETPRIAREGSCAYEKRGVSSPSRPGAHLLRYVIVFQGPRKNELFAISEESHKTHDVTLKQVAHRDEKHQFQQFISLHEIDRNKHG